MPDFADKAEFEARALTLSKQEGTLKLYNEQEYNEAVDRLNILIDDICDNPEDPRYREIETLSHLIGSYDREYYSKPEEPHEA